MVEPLLKRTMVWWRWAKNSQLSVLCMVKCWEWVGEVWLIQEIISALDTEGCKGVRG